jgi:hypothetical protein
MGPSFGAVVKPPLEERLENTAALAKVPQRCRTLGQPIARPLAIIGQPSLTIAHPRPSLPGLTRQSIFLKGFAF